MGTLLGLVAAGIYIWGVWKFWTGFRRTTFGGGKVYLALLWPVFIFNRSYRQNFTKALKG